MEDSIASISAGQTGLRLWLIVGGPNLGKSSLVRALTGVGNAERGRLGKIINVEVNAQTVSMLIVSSAVQELGISINSLAHRIDTRSAGITDVLLTLRENPVRSFPDASSYIHALASVYNLQRPIIHLHGGNNAPLIGVGSVHPILSVAGGIHLATNSVARLVRQLWGWS